MGLDVPATAVLSPSTSTEVSAEHLAVLRNRSCFVSTVQSSPRGGGKATEPSWKAAVHAFLARLGSDVER